MRHLLAGLLALVVLLMPFRICLAFGYTDDEDLIYVNGPDDEGIVVQTDDQAYLPEELHELAAGYELDARLLVRSYTPQDVLGYTLDVVTCPLRSLGPQSASASAADAPANKYTDITGAALRDEAVSLARSMYGDRFTLSAAQTGTFAGQPAMEITGSGAAGSHWSDYDCQVYLLSNDQRLVIITAVYLRSEEEAVGELLGGISLGAPAAAATSAPPAASRTAVPAPAATVAPASAAATADPAAPWGWLGALRSYLGTHPGTIYYVLGAAGVLVLAVGMLVFRRSRRHQTWTLDDENAGRLDLGSAGLNQTGSRRSAKRTNKERNMEASDRTAGSERRQYDYAEDISKYTQQPSADVNDVSRYTHGYDADDSLNDELRALKDDSIYVPQPIKIQSVGSRVERNRRRKRK